MGKWSLRGKLASLMLFLQVVHKRTITLYINLKTISEREQDITLLDKVYQYLLTRAKQLKVTLPQEYGTILCVGNDSKETGNNQFFIQKGYLPLNSFYSMNRDLTEPVLELIEV